jgi:hypothetical protein
MVIATGPYGRILGLPCSFIKYVKSLERYDINHQVFVEYGTKFFNFYLLRGYLSIKLISDSFKGK